MASINKPKKNNDAIINDDIRCKEMLVITNTGEKLGVLPKRLALQAASDRGLDLVLVSPEASPAVDSPLNQFCSSSSHSFSFFCNSLLSGKYNSYSFA